MQINVVQNYSLNKQNTNFKSVYPVTYWVKNVAEQFEPELNKICAKEMNEIIVRMLNEKPTKIKNSIDSLSQALNKLVKSLPLAKNVRQKNARERKIEEMTSKINKLKLTQRVQSYMHRSDSDYANNSVARGFYNQKVSYKDAVAYIATGQDAFYLDGLGKQIGLARRKGDIIAEEYAREKYHSDGLKHVIKKSNQFTLNGNVPYELHVKMPVSRENNKIKDFDIIDMRFFTKDINNPFVSSEWIKK